MKTFREFLNESLNESPTRIDLKRGGGAYEKYRTKGSTEATSEDAVELIQQLKSRLKLTDIKNPGGGFMGSASAPANTLTVKTISDAVADLGATNIKYTSGINGVVKFIHVFFELDGKAYALKVRGFENGDNKLDFGLYSKWS